ncbi:signal peptidase I [Lysinibacter sp. HNR]|uniref:signal peptidase I n=1 Tax=Lysinibacter sp. HNR TaxID=3031408 RepID=UPI002434AC91|nr:signal peptidase I [Lysinibacter sp. HNR]WGD37851.1 signal peptidase I [Lysinibacter sp. HNR]
MRYPRKKVHPGKTREQFGYVNRHHRKSSRGNSQGARRRHDTNHVARGFVVLKSLASGLLVGVLLVLIGVGIAAIAVPALTGSTALTIKTSSMEPSLPPGTMVIIRSTDPEDIKPGEVLTYQLKSGEPTLVTHRVTQRQTLADGTPVFITKGDANAQPDATPVREVQVTGTVWYSIPYVGWVASFMMGENRTFVVTLTVGALLAYAVWMVISSLRENRVKKLR